MHANAVLISEAKAIALERLLLNEAGPDDIVVESRFSGISTGTEKLLFEQRMPFFPGLSYPLVPGYETVGRVAQAGPDCKLSVGDTVFVPGSYSFKGAASLFGATASHLIVDAERAIAIPDSLGVDGTLLALAATAHHAIAISGAPDLIIGHGVLGRICARIVMALEFPAPVVWEVSPARMDGATGYRVCDAADDDCKSYGAVLDVSGDSGILDKAISRLARDGEITLAGFYSEPIAFNFAPAFMREARIRIAAEFTPQDTHAVLDLVASGTLDLSGLISHQAAASDAASAYPNAFENEDCLKMILDWSR